MDCLTRIGNSIVGNLAAPIGNHLGYLFYYDTNMNNVEDQIQTLDATIKRLDKEDEEAQRNGKEKNEDFLKWLSEARMRLNEAKIILDDEGRNEAKCTCTGPFPNLLTRYKLSRRACEMAETIVSELRKEPKEKFRRPILRSSFKNRNFQAFNSTEKTLGEIKEALNDANLSKIGVYGMGGIGKTTIVKEVARQVQEEGLFSEVIMVTVSQSFELKNIQERVAEQLGLKELKGSESEIAKKLKHRLKDEKKILLIFDDIWKKVDLEEAGISFREDQSGCKMIFVSRSRDELCQHMDVQKEIAVGFLSRKEAMDLFVKFVGDLNEKPADFKDVAVEIVAECGDLPISIVTIASALKNKDIADWRNAKRKLKEYSPDEEINKPVYISIKMSYDDVVEREGRLLKSVFLLCALRGEDENISVGELVRYSVGWDLFGYVETWEAARDSMHSAVGRLKARCLLLDGDVRDTVKMHDVIRDVARSIAAKDEKMHSFTEVAKFEWSLNKGNLEDPIAIVLHGRDFNQIPERLKCSRLELLVMFHVFDVSVLTSVPKPIGNACFEEMKELKVLCWGNTKCPELLLASICSLQNLQMLSFPGCELEDIALIGELKNLIILDLSWSTVKQLPQQIGKLTKLQQLKLKYCERLKVIQPHVISNLVKLEELYMDGLWKVNWKIEGVDDGESSYNASLIELKNLQRLKALHLSIVDWRALPEDMDFIENLERYQIIIGNSGVYGPADSYRFLHLGALHERSDLLYQPGFQTLMTKCEDLELGRVFSVSNIISGKLEEIELSDCEMMEEIVYDGNEATNIDTSIEFRNIRSLTLDYLPNLVQFFRSEFYSSPNSPIPLFNAKVAFPNLEKLRLSALDSVKTLWPDRLPKVSSMQNLKKLHVGECKRVEYLFSVAMARSFVQLKELTVKDCTMMKVLVIKESGEEERPKELFPQLETLELSGLPYFRRFYGGDFLELSGLQYFRRFYGGDFLTSDLEISDGTEELEKIEELFFNENVAFSRLEKLIVAKCPKLKYLLSYGMARSLLQLQSLTIKDCRHMEVVVVIKEPFKDGRLENISFSKLEYVELDAPKLLERFSSDDRIECPSLKELCINGWLHELGTYTASSTTTGPIIKDEREVEKRELVPTKPLFTEKVMFSNSSNLLQLFGTSFKSLVSLKIKDCNKVEYLLPLDTVESLAQLKNLHVSGCEAMEEVIVVTKKHREEGSFKKISLPKLESLKLEDLPRLKRFCVADCIKCPLLLKLWIKNCLELRTFVASSAFTPRQTTIKEEIRERDLVGQQPMLNEKVVFPNLEELILFHTGTEILNEIWPSQSSAVPFPKLKVLRLRCSEDRNWGVFLFDIHKYQYLEVIDLGGFSYMQNLRQHPELGAVEQYSGRMLTRLRELYLDRSPMLMHLFEDPKDLRTFQNLEILSRRSCGRWKTLVMSSSVYFQNLRKLRISKCDGMINLLASSVAKWLVQLNTMIISECDQMTEIIVEKEDEAESEIAFTQLETLGLHRLPTLKSFCCGNSKMQFPKLDKVIVSECPQMENFSLGTVITSKLKIVISRIEPVEDDCDQDVWEGDLNASVRMIWANDWYSAVQRLFSETGDQNSEEETGSFDELLARRLEKAFIRADKQEMGKLFRINGFDKPMLEDLE